MSTKIGSKEAALRARREQQPRAGTVASSTLAETGSLSARKNLAAQAAKDNLDGIPPFLKREETAEETEARRRRIAARIAAASPVPRERGPDEGASSAPAPGETSGGAAAASEQKKAGDAPAAKQQEKKVMRAKTNKKAAKAKARTAVKSKKTAPARAGDRSPLAVGEYIVRNAPTMEQLAKHFGIDPHPMRAKVFAARHTLGFKIEHKDGRYSGTAPKSAKA